jgi:hypothetical protein
MDKVSEIDPNLVYGLNWKARTDAEVKLIADTTQLFGIIGDFYKEFQLKSIQDMAALPINPDALNVSEKIHNAKYSANAKMFYTFSNLGQLAKEELDRRFKKRKSRVSSSA